MIEKYREERPWGTFQRFTKEVPSTVKIITVKKGESLSLQYHANRQEFWHILNGNPSVTVGDNTNIAKTGDEFFIDKKIKHRVAAPTDEVQFLEISLGAFDENDIVRLDDKYGRAV